MMVKLNSTFREMVSDMLRLKMTTTNSSSMAFSTCSPNRKESLVKLLRMSLIVASRGITALSSLMVKQVQVKLSQSLVVQSDMLIVGLSQGLSHTYSIM